MDFDEIVPNFAGQLRSKEELAIEGTGGVKAVLKGRKGNEVNIMVPNRQVEVQITRLRDAIKKRDRWLEDRGFKILPFLGYDPRKLLNPNGFEDFKELWTRVGGITSPNLRSNPEHLKNSDVIGIKLYPPIGFNPYGESDEEREHYFKFYEWLAQNQIPITVHCQSLKGGSFSTKCDAVDHNTDPKRWKDILTAEKYPLSQNSISLKHLRINFAHFAGEKDMDDMIDWKRWPNGIDKDTWAWTITELLHEYPNTYSDIAAFDFAPWSPMSIYEYNGAVNALVGLLDKDAQGDLYNGKERIVCEKTLWGSDVPMIISSNSMRYEFCEENESHYKNLFQSFCKAVSRCKKYHSEKDQKTLIRKITCDNTCQFLFPQSS